MRTGMAWLVRHVRVLGILPCVRPSLPRWDHRLRYSLASPATATARMQGIAAVTLGKPFGSPTNSVSIQQLKMKFVDCARNAVRPPADEVVRDAAESFLCLESIRMSAQCCGSLPDDRLRLM